MVRSVWSLGFLVEENVAFAFEGSNRAVKWSSIRSCTHTVSRNRISLASSLFDTPSVAGNAVIVVEPGAVVPGTGQEALDDILHRGNPLPRSQEGQRRDNRSRRKGAASHKTIQTSIYLNIFKAFSIARPKCTCTSTRTKQNNN